MNAELLKKRERRYALTAWGVALLLHAFLVLGFWLSDRLFPEELSRGEGPVMIRLGNPEGTAEKLLESSAAENTDSDMLPEPELAPAEESSVSEQNILSKPVPEVIPLPEPEKTIPIKEETSVPAKVPEPSRQTQPPSRKKTDEEKENAIVETIKGEEQGNSFEYNFNGGNGKIGRNLYVPIALYMPLPWTLESGLFENIPQDIHGFYTSEERQAELLKYYRDDSGNFIKRDTIPMDIRPVLWVILEDSGYDLEKADYKNGRNLRNVQLSFTVSEEAGRLEEVTVEKSSGYSEIDDAVVYGFGKSTYYNSAGFDVKGRFVYRF